MTDEKKMRITIASVGAAIVGALIFCGLVRGCKRDCKDCNEPEPKKEIVVVKDTVVVEQYNVGGDMVNIKGDNNDVNFIKGNGNNVASRNSGTQTWSRAVQPCPKKKTVVATGDGKPASKPEQTVVSGCAEFVFMHGQCY